MIVGGKELTAFVVKITNFCDLNCDYCYMFNQGDVTYKNRPKIMPVSIRDETVKKIVEHAKCHGLSEVHVIFHGGEPLLAGKQYVSEFLDAFQASECGDVRFHFGMQTNGIKLDREWIALFQERGVRIGISLDGPAVINDIHRVHHDGRGSYSEVNRSIELLLSYPNHSEFFGGILCVVDPAQDGLAIYKHFRQMGIKEMDFLLPLSYDWDHMPPFSEYAISDYLIPIFDMWWKEADPTISIRLFNNIINLICGGRRSTDAIGGNPIKSVMVESDGSMEPLDVLRVCENGFTQTNINVLTNSVDDILKTPVFAMAVRGSTGLADGCRGCPVEDICGGGYLPHRYSREAMFNNPNIFCMSLSRLILHIISALSDVMRLDSPGIPEAIIQRSELIEISCTNL
jgi:uncharacterized protein